jgi:pimeloyl-ACP methyl ester carboxylesterase
MFRDLIPLLADRFHIIAPDLPGFGQSEMPARSKFSYTFDNIAQVVGLKRFAIYVFDYGAPAGFRIATGERDCHATSHRDVRPKSIRQVL